MWATILVMKKTTSVEPLELSVAEAKAQLSALLRNVGRQPVVIHNRGRVVAHLVAPRPEEARAPAPFTQFLGRLERLKRELGIKGASFEPERARLRVDNPFENE